MEISKLSPAPWDVEEGKFSGCCYVVDANSGTVINRNEFAFIALARNAFDVMQRRGWGVYPDRGGWSVGKFPGVYANSANPVHDHFIYKAWPDPFTALVEADQWYTANVELPPGTAAAGA